MIQVRRFQDADLAFLRTGISQLHEALRLHDPALPPAGSIIDGYLEYLLAGVRDSDGTILIAEIDGVARGHLVLFGRVPPAEPDEPPEPHAVVADLYVEEALRGRGVGRALLRAAEAQARALGVRRMELKVLAENSAALAFYDALGYAPRVIEMRKFI